MARVEWRITVAGLRIALVNHGTRGDVQPLIAVGRELVLRGHSVVAAVPSGFVDLVSGTGSAGGDGSGIEAVGLPADWRAFLTDPGADRAWLFSGDRAELLAGLRGVMASHGGDIARALVGACAGADLVVSGALTEDVATVIAQARGIPLALVHLFPVRRNGAWANPFVTGVSSVDPAENLATHAAYEQAGWASARDGVNRLRTALGLAETDLPTFVRARELGAVEIQAYSANLVRGLDWDAASRPVVGWLQPDSATRQGMGECGLDASLTEWLAAGDAPGFFGFGSMPVAEATQLVAMIEDVAEELGVRAVIASGWAELPEAAVRDAGRVRVVPSADFSALFPRCVFAVHHGGSNTTGEAARAGIPALAASVMLDQAMWGSAIVRAGVGVHLPLRDFDAATLADAVKQLLDPDMVERAASLGRLVRAEPDPVRRAADILEAHAYQARARS